MFLTLNLNIGAIHLDVTLGWGRTREKSGTLSVEEVEKRNECSGKRAFAHCAEGRCQESSPHLWNPPRHHKPAPGKCDLRHVLGAGQ